MKVRPESRLPGLPMLGYGGVRPSSRQRTAKFPGLEFSGVIRIQVELSSLLVCALATSIHENLAEGSNRLHARDPTRAVWSASGLPVRGKWVVGGSLSPPPPKPPLPPPNCQASQASWGGKVARGGVDSGKRCDTAKGLGRHLFVLNLANHSSGAIAT